MSSQPVFQLRIQLEEIKPTVWRRVLVPGGVRLAKLHDIFQATMGWTNSHLHSFTIGDELYGMQFDDYPEEERDEKAFSVLQALRGDVRRFTYEYDFGDSWTHEVFVENVTWSPLALRHGVCIDGQNACPPEDVGGAGGYERFLEALADPLDEEHDSYLVWVGFKFEADAFDLGATNAALQRVR